MRFLPHSINKAKIRPIHPCRIVIDLISGSLMDKSSTGKSDTLITGILHLKQELLLLQGSHSNNQKVGIQFGDILSLNINFAFRSKVTVTITSKLHLWIPLMEYLHSLLHLLLFRSHNIDSLTIFLCIREQLRCHRSHIKTSSGHLFAINQLDGFHQQTTIGKYTIHLTKQSLLSRALR